MPSTTIHEIPYRGFLPSRPGKIAYGINDDLCVFTGLVKETTSTINAAENVLKAIVQHRSQSDFDPTLMRFADLQTAITYQINPGKYRFDVLEVNWLDRDGPFVNRWERTAPPRWVLDCFASYINAPVA